MKQHVEDTILAQGALTVDGEAFCDVQQCLYWLCKQEILHMTNFTLLHSLCTLLSNSTLQRLKQSNNMTYESEQSMQEMIQAISLVLGKKTLKQVCASPFYSIVLDKAMDLSTVKQLGINVHY